jgi:hypothetical protein
MRFPVSSVRRRWLAHREHSSDVVLFAQSYDGRDASARLSVKVDRPVLTNGTVFAPTATSWSSALRLRREHARRHRVRRRRTVLAVIRPKRSRPSLRVARPRS